jgi:hypothetical protein
MRSAWRSATMSLPWLTWLLYSSASLRALSMVSSVGWKRPTLMGRCSPFLVVHFTQKVAGCDVGLMSA